MNVKLRKIFILTILILMIFILYCTIHLFLEKSSDYKYFNRLRTSDMDILLNKNIIDLSPLCSISSNQYLYSSFNQDFYIIVSSELLKNNFRVGTNKENDLFIYYLFEDNDFHRFFIFRKINKDESEDLIDAGQIDVSTKEYNIIHFQSRDIEATDIENINYILDTLYVLRPEQYIKSVFSDVGYK